MEWIKCADRMPNKSGWYLIWGCYTKDCPHRAMEANFWHKKKEFSIKGTKSKFVTHWMEMPQAPTIEI